MSGRHKLSRREFLKMVGVAASAAIAGACTPQTPTEVVPTTTAVPALEEAEPIVPEMVLVEAGSFQMGSTDGLEDEQPVHMCTLPGPST